MSDLFKNARNKENFERISETKINDAFSVFISNYASLYS